MTYSVFVQPCVLQKAWYPGPNSHSARPWLLVKSNQAFYSGAKRSFQRGLSPMPQWHCKFPKPSHTWNTKPSCRCSDLSKIHNETWPPFLYVQLLCYDGWWTGHWRWKFKVKNGSQSKDYVLLLWTLKRLKFWHVQSWGVVGNTCGHLTRIDKAGCLPSVSPRMGARGCRCLLGMLKCNRVCGLNWLLQLPAQRLSCVCLSCPADNQDRTIEIQLSR